MKFISKRHKTLTKISKLLDKLAGLGMPGDPCPTCGGDTIQKQLFSSSYDFCPVCEGKPKSEKLSLDQFLNEVKNMVENSSGMLWFTDVDSSPNSIFSAMAAVGIQHQWQQVNILLYKSKKGVDLKIELLKDFERFVKEERRLSKELKLCDGTMINMGLKSARELIKNVIKATEEFMIINP